MFSPGLDSELGHEEELKLQEHLEGCPGCRAEWSEWQSLAQTLRSFRGQELAAPSGFSSAVMLRIESEQKTPPAIYWRRWKQAAAAVAAALLLAAGSMAIRPDVVQHIAWNPGTQVVENNGGPVGLANDNIGDKSPAEKPGAAGTEAADVEKAADPPMKIAETTDKSPDAIHSASFELTSRDRSVYSTLVKINVDDARQAEARAGSLAGAYGASLQSFGQSSEGDNVYYVDTIAVNVTDAQGLIKDLRNLGILTYEETHKVDDLNQRYSEVFEQLMSLRNQHAASQDESQKQKLDSQISKLEEQLQTWDKRSQEQTIVLWIHQK